MTPAIIAVAMLAALGTMPQSQTVPVARKPAVVQYLQRQGLAIQSRFAVPGGLTGYVATTPDGRRIVFYVPADGSVALFGALIDAQGNNLTRNFFEHYVQNPANRKLYDRLATWPWVGAGATHPRRIVYAFVDPNCPYCQRFWKAAQRAYAHGVQVRYVLVAILGGSSVGKAAAVLAARDRRQALNYNERGFHDHSGAIKPLAHIPQAVRQQLARDAALMQQFGFDGTPGLVWKDANGRVQTSNGLPPPEDLEKVFGIAAKPSSRH